MGITYMTHTDIESIERIKSEIKKLIKKHKAKAKRDGSEVHRGIAEGLEIGLTYFSELCA